MREIKFRAKTIEDIWVYGYYFYSELEDKHYIIGESKDYGYQQMEVKKETVGQYTELKDKKDKEVYNGDIIKVYNGEDETEISSIRFDYGGFWAVDLDCEYGWPEDYEVIGNVHDNKDLLNK